MKACPDEGRLRGSLDEEVPGVERHLADCVDCRHARDALRVNAEVAREAIASLQPTWVAEPPPVDGTGTGRRSVRLAGMPTAVAAGLVALALLAMLVLTPTGRRPAAGFLASFRAERLTVVTFDPDQSLAGLDALSDLATVTGEPEVGAVEVDDLGEAAVVAGFQPAAADPADLLSQLDQPATIMAAEPHEVRARFSVDRAPDLPEQLDGATLVIAVPGIVVQQFSADDELLLVGEAGQLSAELHGDAGLDELRQYLLTRPEIPDGVAEQLLGLDDWATTLPIPVPTDGVGWEPTTVNGQPGLWLSLDDGLGNGLLWQQDGRIHWAGGSLTARELRQVVDGLQL